MTAHLEDAARIFGAVVSLFEHRLVAGAFALLEHLPAYPPDRGMKPEYGLHHAMHDRASGFCIAPVEKKP